MSLTSKAREVGRGASRLGVIHFKLRGLQRLRHRDRRRADPPASTSSASASSSRARRGTPTSWSARARMTMQIKDRIIRIYEQMAEPKFVVAVGTCACSGGVFKGCYNVEGGVDAVIPVSAYVPGCPARPGPSIDGVVKLLSTLVREAAPKVPLEPQVKEAANG